MYEMAHKAKECVCESVLHFRMFGKAFQVDRPACLEALLP